MMSLENVSLTALASPISREKEARRHSLADRNALS